MNLGEIFQGGPTNAKWAALGRYLRANQVFGGIGVRMRRQPSGVIISAVPGNKGGVIAPALQPFEVIAATQDGDPAIRVVPSTVFGITPEDMTGTDDPQFFLTGLDITPGGSEGFIFAKIDRNSTPATVTIEAALEMPDPADDPEAKLYHRAFARYTLDAEDNLTAGNLSYGPLNPWFCGDEIIWG